MSEQALSEGTKAYLQGLPRTANPFDPSTEDWMCWRDGFDQARAVSERRNEDAPPAAVAIAGQ
jgi:hypothetical protein